MVIATITNTNTNTILVIIIITSIITIITIITRVRSAWIEVETGTCIQRVELNQSSPLYQVVLVGVMLIMMGMMIMMMMMMMVWNQSLGGLEDHHSDANE